MLNNSVTQGDLSNDTVLPSWESIGESGESIEYWRKLLPQLVLGVVFVTINCVIVSAMWQKQGKRLSNYSLITILASSVLFALFPFSKPLVGWHGNTLNGGPAIGGSLELIAFPLKEARSEDGVRTVGYWEKSEKKLRSRHWEENPVPPFGHSPVSIGQLDSCAKATILSRSRNHLERRDTATQP